MIEAALFWICLLAAVLGLAALPLVIVMGGHRAACVAGTVIILLVLSAFWRPV